MSIVLNTVAITPEQWDNYKSQFPNDPKIQAVTLDELLKNTDSEKVDWENIGNAKKKDLATSPHFEKTNQVQFNVVSPCKIAMGFVIFDVICLAIGGVGLRATATTEVAIEMVEAAAPVLSKIEIAIAKMAAKEASMTDIASGVFEILKAIYSGGCLGAVLSAFLGSLTWYYALLYGAMAMATIVAVLATDGIAFVAEVVIVLATAGFVVVDSVSAYETCSGG